MRNPWAAGACAGVVEGGIEPPVPGDDPADKVGNGCGVVQVRLDERGLAARSLDLRHDCIAFSRATARQDDLGSLRCEQQRTGRTDPRRAAGYQSDFAS